MASLPFILYTSRTLHSRATKQATGRERLQDSFRSFGGISFFLSRKMGHGGYGMGKVAISHRPKSLGVEKNQRKPKSVAVKNQKKPKSVSMKNQIRSTERMLLRKGLPPEVREAQENKLQDLKKQQDVQVRLAVERKIFLRYRKIKFFERRKVERAIRRLEKLQRTSSDHTRDADITDQLSKLKEDLEYVRFFPKTEKYVSLFNGAEDAEIVDKRNKLRKQIKANIVAAAASGKDLEETGSEDDGLLDMSEDDFFLNGSSSDEVDADDEWTDKSTREQASSASGKATSGMSSDDKNQRQMSARALMPPPGPSKNSFRPANRAQTRIGSSSSKKAPIERDQLSIPRNTSYNRSGSSARNQGSSNAPVERVQLSMPKNTSYNRSGSSARNQGSSNAPVERVQLSTSSNTSYSRSGYSGRNQGSSNARTGHSSNISSNSDAHKPKRKRRPKKKKQQS